MKVTAEQFNAADVAYAAGRQLAILNPDAQYPTRVAQRVDDLMTVVGFGPRRASAAVERFETMFRKGFRDVRAGEGILAKLRRQEKIGMGPTKTKLTPPTAVGMTG
jgi:hypothetical protein